MLSHRTTVSFALCLAVTLAIFSLSFLWLAQPLAYAQEQPDALGSISGTVRNEQGEPLPNITVRLENYIFPGNGSTTTTNAEGAYTFLYVQSAGYKLHFKDTAGVYADTYYKDALFIDDAETVMVNGHPVSGVDVDLTRGGSLLVAIQTSVPATDTHISAMLYGQTATGR